jgi:hypothetical protein
VNSRVLTSDFQVGMRGDETNGLEVVDPEIFDSGLERFGYSVGLLLVTCREWGSQAW